jgi:hypothetical protein
MVREGLRDEGVENEDLHSGPADCFLQASSGAAGRWSKAARQATPPPEPEPFNRRYGRMTADPIQGSLSAPIRVICGQKDWSPRQDTGNPADLRIGNHSNPRGLWLKRSSTVAKQRSEPEN